MGALQPFHLLIVAGVVLLVFGPKRLPQLAKGIGESMRELKKTLHGVTDSEPVATVKELGESVKQLKQELNPLAPPSSAKQTSSAAAQAAPSPPSAAGSSESPLPPQS
jgi:TatA/E family protein of Tat protein translocase